MMEQTGTHPSTPRRQAILADQIPAHIRRSPLMHLGGYQVFAGIPDDDTHAQLLSEALSLAPASCPSDVLQSDDENVRGGSPARRFLSVVAGQVQQTVYHDEQFVRFIQKVAGIRAVPSGQSGTFTYYSRPGDYLAIHRDIDLCDIAVISCLYDGPRFAENGGLLALYPSRLSEPLSAIRATPETGVVKVRLAPGQTIVMFGGIVPHGVLPITRGQVRIVSVLCYRDMAS